MTKADIDVYLNDQISINGEVRGHGFGELICAIMKCAAFDERRKTHKKLH